MNNKLDKDVERVEDHSTMTEYSRMENTGFSCVQCGIIMNVKDSMMELTTSSVSPVKHSIQTSQ